MIIIRFIRLDGKQPEEYYYYKVSDAFYHMHIFRHDTSHLYKRIEMIAYVDGTEEIIDCINFTLE